MHVLVDAAYFKHYCGHGAYAEHYLYHSGIEHCIEIVDRFAIEVRSVAVLGTATGEVLRHFDDAWGILPCGCELSRWAHRRIPARYRRRVVCTDMRRFIPRLARAGRCFDLLFTNALMYLPAREMRGFLTRCATVGRYLHYQGSTSEDFEPGDRYRATLRPRRWWRTQFLAAGFAPTRSRYLWRSTTVVNTV